MKISENVAVFFRTDVSSLFSNLKFQLFADVNFCQFSEFVSKCFFITTEPACAMPHIVLFPFFSFFACNIVYRTLGVVFPIMTSHDFEIFLTPLSLLSRFFLLRPLDCGHKNFDHKPPKTVTSFMGDPLIKRLKFKKKTFI